MEYSEYWQEVGSIVDALRDDVAAGYVEPDEYSDWLHDTIDGHRFVIYTAQAQAVLLHSLNDCAIFAEMGPQTWEDWGTAYSQAAFFALRADVESELQDRGGEDYLTAAIPAESEDEA